MSFNYTAHVPADAMPRAMGPTDRPEQPFVLVAVFKLVLMAAALVVFTPLWLNLLSGLANQPSPFPWLALRLSSFAGSVILIVFAVMIVKVWLSLVKHLARAD